jgi:four helix bundle suffix protein
MNGKNEKAKPSIIPPHGGYRNLKSYQTAGVIYDTPPPPPPCQGGEKGEVDRFIDKRSRTHDQMVQAARSSKQNIAEGSMASGTSKKSELIHQANYLLDQQLRQLEKQFLEKGGFAEKLYQARQQVRRR